jgi:murein DD-endopeptidase MepM/ murein hydrolase activator NlpD
VNLEELLKANQPFHSVVPFNAAQEKLLLLDFSNSNIELHQDIFKDTLNFTEYVNSKLQKTNSHYGIGGYGENRIVYSRSRLFSSPLEGSSTAGSEHRTETGESSLSTRGEGEGVRSLHLGIDIWGDAGTPVYAPMEASVHSFSYNDGFGNYGATLILQHKLEDIIFHTLYGHLSLKSIEDKKEDQKIEKGEWIASFGEPHENGNWPPHLHFQIIRDMGEMKGDYRGVCSISEKDNYLNNCPDPDLILQMMEYAVPSPLVED